MEAAEGLWLAALADDLAKAEARVVTHMNEDHADSCLAMAHWHCQMPSAVSAEMTALCVEGFRLKITMPDGTAHTRTVPYAPPVEKASDLRRVAVVRRSSHRALVRVVRVRIDGPAGILSLTCAASNVPPPVPPRSHTLSRARAQAMHFEAFNGMGVVYKLRSGFYARAAANTVSVTARRIRAWARRNPGTASAAVAAGAAAGVAAIWMARTAVRSS